MAEQVTIQEGVVREARNGNQYLLLKYLDAAGEEQTGSCWDAHVIGRWMAGEVPVNVFIDSEVNQNGYTQIKDLWTTASDIPVTPAQMAGDEELDFVNPPSKDDLFGAPTAEMQAQPTQQRRLAPSPELRQQVVPRIPTRGTAAKWAHRQAQQLQQQPSASFAPGGVPAVLEEQALYEKGLAIMQQPSFLEHVTAITPEGKSTKRLVQSAIAAVMQDPSLLECSKLSLVNSVVQAVGLGLEVNTPLGEAYLIKYGQRAQFIPGYRGLIELMVRSGRVSHVQAFLVHENDEFDHLIGQVPTHRRAAGDRGEIVGVWGLVIMSNGQQVADYMSREEVDEIRNATSAKRGSPWESHYGEMARKTIIRRMAKTMPKSGGLSRALDVDDYEDDEPEVLPFVVEDDVPEPEAIAPPAGGSGTALGGPRYSHAGLLVQQTGPTTADVESMTTPGKMYPVDFIDYVCICPDANYRGHKRAGGCKHVQAARDVLGNPERNIALDGTDKPPLHSPPRRWLDWARMESTLTQPVSPPARQPDCSHELLHRYERIPGTDRYRCTDCGRVYEDEPQP